MNRKILLTGSSGFIGKNLLQNLYCLIDYSVVCSSRNIDKIGRNEYFVPLIDAQTDWSPLLSDIDYVVHLAGRAHQQNISDSSDQLYAYRKVNTDGVINLARQAAESGIKRFIFISSIGVNGLGSRKPFRYDDAPSPQEPYAVSKYEAEVGLQKIAKETGMEIVIIRPPLVYAANAPGNFGKLTALAKNNLPLPLGAMDNKRSLVGIDNLVDLIITCIDHPKAANQTFLVSDDNDVSTSHLLRSMILSAGKTPFLLPVPIRILRFFAGLLGKASVIDRMSSNLQIDISHTKSTLGWKPPVSFEEGIRRCFK
ncbi:MAG: NAD-dependent epimerase/dehydratase family protein [Cocleimonas sp.]